MIPCPDCDHLCGVRDMILLGEALYYRCERCLTAFHIDPSLSETDLVREDDDVRELRQEDVFDLSDDDDTTPLVPPPHLAGIVLDDLRKRMHPRVVIEVTPPLGALVAESLSRHPSFELPPPGAPALAAPLLPREERTTRRERRSPLPPPPDSSPPSPRRPTPLTFGAAELTPMPTPASASELRPRIVLAARRMARAVVAASAVAGLAAALALVAKHPEALDRAPRMTYAVASPVTEPLPVAPKLALPPIRSTPEPSVHVVAATPIAPKAAARIVAMAPAPPPLTEAETLVAAADRAYRDGRLDRAAELYESALRVSPGFVPARLGAAAADWDRGRRVEARARYQALAADVPEAVPRSLRDRGL